MSSKFSYENVDSICGTRTVSATADDFPVDYGFALAHVLGAIEGNSRCAGLVVAHALDCLTLSGEAPFHDSRSQELEDALNRMADAAIDAVQASRIHACEATE